MKLGCLLFLFGFASGKPCVPLPAPYQAGYIDAQGVVREEVEQAIGTANELLVAAGRAHRLVSLTRVSDAKLRPHEIGVYLITEPGMAAVHAQSKARMAAAVDKFRLENFEIDERYRHLSDHEEGVENFYRGPQISELVVSTLESVVNSNIATAEVSEQCRCIILRAPDLQRFATVFERPWGSFLIGARWSGESIPPDYVIPKILLREEGIPLRWFLPNVLLHEVGHHDMGFSRPLLSGDIEPFVQSVEAALTGIKAEEFRADAFAATVLREGCFAPGVPDEAKQSCITTVTFSMLVFGITFWGKSREARCIRYFDWNAKYPNYHFRTLLVSTIFTGSPQAVSLAEDYLFTRKALSQQPWIEEIPRCRAMRAATPLPNSAQRQADTPP